MTSKVKLLPFVFCFLVLFSFSISAADTRDTFVYGDQDNISAYVSVPAGTELPTHAWYYADNMQGELTTPLLRALAVFVWHAGIYDQVSYSDLSSWASVILLDCQIRNDYTFIEACDFVDWLYPMDSFEAQYVVAFSPAFVSQFDTYYRNLLDSLDLSYADYAFYLNSVVYTETFYNSPFSYVYYQDFVAPYVYPSHVVLEPYIEYLESYDGGGLLNMFSILWDSLDIASFTSWLPPAIAGQFISYFAMFVSLLVFLLIIKVLHG